MTVGQSIKQCRKKKCLTQKALAEKIGTSSMNVSFWETDRFSPSLIMLISMADVLNVTIDELIGRTVRV